MKILSIVVLLFGLLFAEPHKVYYYAIDKNIDNFKRFKIEFDRYLAQYGEYTFQAFSEKEVFEDFIEDGESILMLSSLHYKQLIKKYNLTPLFVAQKKRSITDTNIIVGKDGSSLEGTVTTAFSVKYTQKLLHKTFSRHHLSLLKVPKEIDALMSVGYGMSQFASVSKKSYFHLMKTNPTLTKNMRIYSESDPNYRMLVAVNKVYKNDSKITKIFTQMKKSKKGRVILKHLGIDNIVRLSKRDLRTLGGHR
jgi:hypothetical protein